MSLHYGHRASIYCSVAAIVSAVACGSASPPVAPSTTSNAPGSKLRIVVLGDSLAVSPSKASAFPARLQERLDASYPGWVVSNEGVGGDTTADGLQRL